jgi:hypothetical protein
MRLFTELWKERQRRKRQRKKISDVFRKQRADRNRMLDHLLLHFSACSCRWGAEPCDLCTETLKIMVAK